jgi:ribosome maturation factor RimP
LKPNKKRSKGKKAVSADKQMLPENRAEILAGIKNIVEQICEYEGMELVRVEYQREMHGRILRLYIDRPGGVKLDDCAHISRQVGDLLDMELNDLGPYNLEVSSPGFNRPLAKKIDFERFKGNEVKVKTNRSIDGQKNFKGVLSGISEGTVELMIDKKTIAIPFEEIARARLINYDGE